MRIHRYIYLIPAILSIAASFTGCRPGEKFHITEGAVWNTTFTIKYSCGQNLDDSIMAVMNRIELSLSPFNSNSLISKINDNRSLAVDRDIINVMKISREINRASGKAFDPTVSPLINLWGFGYQDQDGAVPDDSMIIKALTYVGIDSCHINPDMTVHKKSPETTFNFSAVTKGYACDEIGRMFNRNNVSNYMVEIGGEIALCGNNDRGTPWRVMIDAPVDSVAGHHKLVTIEITNCGIATSGNYRNFRDTGSGRIGHTISPVTGQPVSTSTLSATVIAPDCATADALATACMAMPSDSALTMIEQLESTECLLVIAEDSTQSVVTTSEFPL